MVRLVLAVSLDGRLAPPEGGPAQLGGVGDRKMLEQALAWSDAALCGAGTLRQHRCTCLIHDCSLLKQRANAGRGGQPISILVSRQMQFPCDWPFFYQPIRRWLLCPRESAQASLLVKPERGFERCLGMEGSWLETFQMLSKLRINRLVVLGGAHLTASLLQADVVDELQLTLTPRLLAGNKCWLPPQVNDLPQCLATQEAWQLNKVENLGDNELLICYFRNRYNVERTHDL